MEEMVGCPMVSIIIVNWNGRKWLSACLASLQKQTYPNIEIIIVDNASSDGSSDFIQEGYPKIKLVQTGGNLGFAGGNNAGLKHAQGEYILLLNNDTWVEDDFVAKLKESFDAIPGVGSIQSKLVLMDNSQKLDVVGSYWTDSTFLYHYGYAKEQSLTKYNRAIPVFSNKGASMLLSRKVIDIVGLFDDDFWCYYEETDLCHRIWLAGYECWYCPEAVAHHAMGGSSLRFENSFIQYHNFKNKLLSFIKNFELKTLLAVIPTYIMANVLLSIFWLAKGKIRHSIALYKAIWWNLSHIRSSLRKRKTVQNLRQKSDKEIFLKVKKNPRATYYGYLLTGDIGHYKDTF